MNTLHKLRNYFCYCGIEKEEYNELKKDAYISNFRVWKMLHILMAVVFALLFASSLIVRMMGSNRTFYLIALIYSVAAVFLFCVLKQDSLIAQLVI